MSNIIGLLEKKFVPFAVKLGSNTILMIIRNSMCACMALLIIGSMSILLSNLPFAPLANLLSPAAPFFNAIFSATTGLMGLFTAASIAYYASLEYESDLLVTILTSIGAFILTQMSVSAESEMGMILDIDGLGTPGILTAIIVGFTTVRIISYFKKKKLGIKMPEGVPDAVSESFTSLVPAILIFIIFGLISIFLGFNLNHGISRLMSPLTYMLNSVPGYAFYHMLCALVFFCGINSQVVIGVVMPFLLQNGAANEMAFKAGEKLIYPATYSVDTMIWAGGTGATIGLVIIMFFTAKSKYFKTLGKLSFGPGLFNINEPIIFGAPICFNPIFLIPFVLTPGILAGTTFFLMKNGIIEMASVGNIPWTIPPVIVGFLMSSGSIGTTIWSGIIVVISMLIYYPFFRIADNQLYEKELQEGKTEEN